MRSSVTLYLKDHFGEPIQNLQVEIRGTDLSSKRKYHAAATDTLGALQFSVDTDTALSVHVKRWTSDEMKEVARLIASSSEIAFHLTSPKTLHHLPTKVDSPERGSYWRGRYTVKRHDNLTGIARKYHTTVDVLKHLNHLDSDLILVGQTLKVPPVESRKTDSPVPARPALAKTPPKTDHGSNERGAPTTVLRKAIAPIIFPLLTRPLNDEGGTYGTPSSDYTWVKALGSGGHNQARFGATRGGGRLHAARDLYVKTYTPIVAVAPGVVIKCEFFYCKTWQISVRHKTTDGREFIALYGEVDPSSITVKIGDTVSQGQTLARSGVLMKDSGTPLHVVGTSNVSMLHFEVYRGDHRYDASAKLNGPSLGGPFQRRADLIDSLAVLQEGYRATFLDAPPLVSTGQRIPINQLSTSERGKVFIKGWEGVHLDETRTHTYYYDDSKGYCTVGWGHLVRKASCAECGHIAMSSKMPIEESQTLFDNDLSIIEGRVRNAITASLFQHEFDALMSLAFNLGSLRKTPNLCDRLNRCDYEGAPGEFLDIENRTRRQREHDMFCHAIYNSTH